MISVYLSSPQEGTKTPVKNAFNVSYEMNAKELFTASFSLPANDRLVSRLKNFSFVEIYDGDKRIELFMIVKVTEDFSSDVPTVKYELFDALYILNLSVMNDYHQLTNPGTREALNYVLNQQYQTNWWVLGECDFSRGFSYAWENENGLLDPLFSIPHDFGEDYEFVRDTTQFPFVLHLKKTSNVVKARIREGYNLKNFTVEREGKNLVNAIIPKGNAEGVNTVDIKRLNNGTPYLLDYQSMNEYLPAWYIWKDERYTIEENLYDAARAKLNAWKQPKVTWNISAVDLTKVINRPENLKANKGKIARVNDLNYMDVVVVELEKYGEIQLRITKRAKSDVTGSPQDIQLQLTNEEPGGSQADYKRQQEIAKMTAMGAQSVIPFVFDREADENHPVEFKFFVFDEVVNVNSAMLWVNTTRFRATSKANKSVDTVVQTATSSAGGGTVSSSTTSAGGGSVQSTTSGAGGGATTSSGGAGNVRLKLFDVAEGPINPNWGEGLCVGADGWGLAIKTGYIGSFYSNGTTGNHTHSVNIPSHSHNVSINIPSHTHSVSMNIPSHTHSVSITIPGHTHDIIYGIFEYSNTPKTLEVWVDDNKVNSDSISINQLDMRPYMKKDSSGKITRGYHTLKIKPSDLARLEIQIMLIVFVKSRIGEKL